MEEKMKILANAVEDSELDDSVTGRCRLVKREGDNPKCFDGITERRCRAIGVEDEYWAYSFAPHKKC